MEQASREHGAGRPDRMAVRDRTAFDIHHVLGQTELTLDSDRDRSKGLVDLDPLDVADLPPGSLLRLADRWHRPDPEHAGLDRADPVGDQTRRRLDALALGKGGIGLAATGYRHEPVSLATSWGDASLRLLAIHLVFGLAKRWLLGTHHGAVGAKHLPAYLDEFMFRFNRRTANNLSHRFARVIEHAVRIPPTTYRTLVVAAPAWNAKSASPVA
jgi:ISXO2-like transposase domain